MMQIVNAIFIVTVLLEEVLSTECNDAMRRKNYGLMMLN